MRILKFPLQPYGPTEISTGSQVNALSVGVDGKNQPCVWVEAEEGSEVKTVFEAVLTGSDVPQDTKRIIQNYVGTIFVKTGDIELPMYVMHIYQWIPRWTSEQLKQFSQVGPRA